ATDRVALFSLRGPIDRPDWTQGHKSRICVPLTYMLVRPGGSRDRQLLWGTDVTVIETRGAHAFVQSDADGYCGWIDATTLGMDRPQLTHRVTAAATHVYPAPDMKTRELCSLSLGSRLTVTGIKNGFASLSSGGFVPVQHIAQDPATDPVMVAEILLGTPYLWGGNSTWGIDCSGLVQMALLACDQACPADSDLQQAAFPRTDRIERGDLLFWPGHVAMAVSDEVMIHATAWKMSVILEPIASAITRIDASGDGPFLGAHRP
ncbi:MAG: NlpC/P60 family protein, partial [Paracoccus sp. (in: a-proteobacteria)]|nr:NlpC/P60 family protein [Paracoccus sp. (in: a-proteobacteria)]